MRSETKQLISNSTIYSVGNVFTKFVAFLLIPLYARKLSPDAYGVVAILELIELVGTTIFVLGLGNSVLRFFAQYKKRNQENELVFSILSVLLFTNIIILGTLFIFPEGIVKVLLTLSRENILYFRYMLIVIFVGVFQRIFIVNLQAEEKAFYYISFTLTNFTLLIVLNIYKVGILNQGILGIVESKFYVALLNAFLFLVYFFLRFKPGISSALIRESISFGTPLIFVGISMNLITLVDRYILKELADFSSVGIYTMAYKFGMVINIVLVTPFRLAFYPLMFKLVETQNLGKLYRKYMIYYLFSGLILFLSVSLYAKEIMLVFTAPEYISGYFIIPIICFSYLLDGIRNITTNILAAKKKTRIIAFTAVFGLIMNVALNFILIPVLGIFGAAAATLLAYTGIVIIGYIYQQKIFFIQWDWKRISQLFLIATAIFILAYLPISENIYMVVIWKLFFLLSFPVILYFSRFFNEAEIESFKKLFQRFSK